MDQVFRAVRDHAMAGEIHQIAVLQIIVPSKLDDEQRELLTSYAETENIEINATNPSFWNRIKDAVTGR